MKKILIIAYQFPPLGGSGVQRTAKFVKYLRSFDFEPVVITRREEGMGLKDDSLLADLPGDIKVYRLDPFDFTEWKGIFTLPGKFIARKLLIPDGERLFASFNRSKALKICDIENIDVIYSTSYPYSDHLLALYLKKNRPNIPWVADFRDEWTNNPYLADNPHIFFRQKIEKSEEKKVLTQADRLITNTPLMLANFLKDDPFLKNKFYCLPNGYDEEDFYGLGEFTPDRDKFTMTYTGLLYGRRRPDTFFEALTGCFADNRDIKDKTRVNFIGNYKVEQFKKTIENYGLSSVVTLYPYMEHKKCLEFLSRSDILLLIEGKGPGAENFYTGKIFEYMRLGRPTLGIIPINGAAAGLIRDTGIGLVSDFDDISSIRKNIMLMYEAWREGKDINKPDAEKIKNYSRKNLTKQLAEILTFK